MSKYLEEKQSLVAYIVKVVDRETAVCKYHYIQSL